MNQPTQLTQDRILVKELRERERNAASMPHFAFATLNIKAAAHHKLIYQCLMGLVNDEYDDLIVNTPPGSAKSTLISQVFPSWYLGHYPKNNVIITSHTTTLAEQWSKRTRDLISMPEYTDIFPGTTISKDSSSVSRWATAQGGTCAAAGVGMAILGIRADFICIDDPVSGSEQAESITQLQKLHEWFKSDLKSRLKPRAKMVLVCQRMSANDLAGFMIDSHAENPTRRLRVLNLPMVADSPNDPLGRAIGERLWPEWYTEEMVADLRKDDYTWRTMWQQQPPSESGSWVSPDEVGFRPSPEITPTSSTYGCTDLAISVNSGDYTVHIVIAVNERGEWDIVEAQRARVDPSASATTVVNLCETYKPKGWAIDDDNASKVFMPLVATRAMAEHTFVPWWPVPLRGQDKETRAASLRGHFKRRMVFMPKDAPFTRWLLNEIFGFPNLLGQGVDDGVDALSALSRKLLSIVKKPMEAAPPKPSPTIQEMTLNQLFEDREHRGAGRRHRV